MQALDKHTQYMSLLLLLNAADGGFFGEPADIRQPLQQLQPGCRNCCNISAFLGYTQQQHQATIEFAPPQSPTCNPYAALLHPQLRRHPLLPPSLASTPAATGNLIVLHPYPTKTYGHRIVRRSKPSSSLPLGLSDWCASSRRLEGPVCTHAFEPIR